MNFLIDANLPRRLTALFAERGHTAFHTLDLPEGNATPDLDILNVAALGRLCEASQWDAQADSIVPPGVHPHHLGASGLDRYAYGFNNPSRYTDPSGHEPGTMCDKGYYEYCFSHPAVFFGGYEWMAE